MKKNRMPRKKVMILFIMSYFSRLSVGRLCRFYDPKWLWEHWNLKSWPIGPTQTVCHIAVLHGRQTIVSWNGHTTTISVQKRLFRLPPHSHKAEGSISEVGILTFASMFKADSDSQALFNKSTIYVSVSQQDGNIKNHVAHRMLTLCAKTN